MHTACILAMCMAATSTTLRIDRGTRDRLCALANRPGQPMGEIVRTLSYADVPNLLNLFMARGAAEAGTPSAPDKTMDEAAGMAAPAESRKGDAA